MLLVSISDSAVTFQSVEISCFHNSNYNSYITFKLVLVSFRCRENAILSPLFDKAKNLLKTHYSMKIGDAVIWCGRLWFGYFNVNEWHIYCLMLDNLMLLLVFSDSGSVLKKFLDETANMSADDRAKHLEKNQVR